MRSAAETLASLGGDVGVPHERFSHQDGLCAAFHQPLDIGAGVDAALGDQERGAVACCVLRVAGKESRREASSSVVAKSTLKVFKLRLFTPIRSAPAFGHIELGFVVHLDQSRQARSRGQRMEMLQLGIA